MNPSLSRTEMDIDERIDSVTAYSSLRHCGCCPRANIRWWNVGDTGFRGSQRLSGHIRTKFGLHRGIDPDARIFSGTPDPDIF